MLARSIPAQNEKAVVQGDPVQLAQPHLSDEAILQSAPGSSMTADQYFEYEAAFLRNTGDGRPFTEHSGKRVTWTCVIDQTDISTNGEVNLVFAHCPSAERLRLTLDQEKQLEILNQRRVVEERKSKEAELEWKKANPSAENVDDDKVRTLWEAYSAAQDTQLETMWKIAALVSKVGTYQQARGATRFALHFYNKSEWNQIKEAVAKKQRPPAQVPAWLTSIPELADLASSPELAADLASSKKSAVTATVEGILYPGKEISDLVSLRYCRLIEIFSAGE
ncbi:MAG TPA: hypothetical protein VFG04_25195 [Planctomycetaceae bacterium]|nr:hypothetical protein [Planctomycetaceae bacterium]